MSTLTKALERIINWRQTYYPEGADFRSGLTPQQIEDITQDFPFKLPLEVYELYQYCDGSKGGVNIAPYLNFYSLKQALDICCDIVYTEVFYSLGFSSTKNLETYQNFCDFINRPDTHEYFFSKYTFDTYTNLI